MPNMKSPTFEDFLRERHAELFPTVLDDDMPDHFDNWLGQLDGEEYMEFAQAYGDQAYNLGTLHGYRDGVGDIHQH